MIDRYLYLSILIDTVTDIYQNIIYLEPRAFAGKIAQRSRLFEQYFIYLCLCMFFTVQ